MPRFLVSEEPYSTILGELAETSLEACVLLLGVGLFLHLGRGLAASLRHQILVSAVLSVPVIFVGSVWMDIRAAEPPPVPGAAAGMVHKFAESELPVAPNAARSGRVDVPQVLVGLWLAGVALCLFRLGWRMAAVLRLARTSREICHPEIDAVASSVARELSVRPRFRLFETAELSVPMIWGPPGSAIFLPRSYVSWPRERLRMVFLHELAHLKRHDVLWSLVCELVCCVFWFHPLLRKAVSRLSYEQELATDDIVLRHRVKPSSYSSFLLELARECVKTPSPAVHAAAMAGGSEVHRRLRSILDPGRRRKSAPRMFAVAAIVAVAALAAVAVFDLPRASAQEMKAAEDLNTPEAMETFLDPLAAVQMEKHNVAGCVFLMVKDGEVFFSKSYGLANVERQQPVVTDRTIFRIGSVSKVFTAVAVMQLVDRGLIDLEDNVNRHLKAFQVADTFPEPVRVKHLLTHTAGFDQLGYGRHVTHREEQTPMAEFLRDNLVRIRPPGVVTAYDTYGVTLAGHLIEAVSGLAFHDYLEKHIFGPLGMNRSNIYPPDHLTADVAMGYGGDSQQIPQRWEFMNTDPASTINSTALDMSYFLRMFLQDGQWNGARVLSPNSIRGLTTRKFRNHPDLLGYTYLLFEDETYGVKAVTHGGSMTGFSSWMLLLPQHGIGVFMAFNRENGAFIDDVLGPLMSRLVTEEIVRPELQEIRLTAAESDRFTGTYAHNVYNHSAPERGGWSRRPFEIEADGEGRLVIRGKPYSRVGDLLFEGEQGARVGFREDGFGDVTHMFIRQNVYEKLANRQRPVDTAAPRNTL